MLLLTTLMIGLALVCMANTYNYRWGNTQPVSHPLKAGVAVQLGDICYRDAGDSYTLKPAGSFTWDTDLATTQTAFHLVFAGVAMQAYDGTNTPVGIKDSRIRVAQDGVFEFDCASASFKVGDLIGPAKQSGNLLEPQKVAAVATELLAIGRCAEETSSATKVKVRITAKIGSLLS